MGKSHGLCSVGLVVVLGTGSQNGPPWGLHDFSAYSAGFVETHPLPQYRFEGGDSSAPAMPRLIFSSYTT